MPIRSPFTKLIPAGTENLSFNVPAEVAQRYREEAAEDGLGLGDWIINNLNIAETVKNDPEFARDVCAILVRERPKKAPLFGAGFIQWLNPMRLMQQAGKTIGL